jgi:hypothetical protein
MPEPGRYDGIKMNGDNNTVHEALVRKIVHGLRDFDNLLPNGSIQLPAQ